MLLHMTQDDLDDVMESACSYAMGRSTYADSGVRDVLDNNCRHISDASITLIHEIAKEQNLDDWNRILTRREHEPFQPGDLQSDKIDLRILFACAFRHDMQDDDLSIPDKWMRYAHEYPTPIMEDNWRYCTARDLVWAYLIPLDEPLGDIQNISGRCEADDDRWVRFFRLMRDGKEESSI